jgi:hypothetical protein
MNQNHVIKILVIVLAVLILSTIIISAAETPSALTAGDNLVSVFPANLIWQKNYGGTADDRALYMLPTQNGYLVVGSTKSIVPNATLGWALMLDKDGNTVWNKTYFENSGGELRYALNLTDGFLLVGNQFQESGDINGYVVKIDGQGVQLWNVTLGATGTNKLFSAIAAPDGFVLFGLTSSYGIGASQGWMVKLNTNGSIVWSKTYGDGADTALRSGVLAPDDNYVASGYTNKDGSGNYDFLLLKIDLAGSLVWNKTYSTATDQKAYSMTKASDGYVIVGDTESTQTNIDAWVLKVDFNGNKIWDKTVGGKQADSPSYITEASDGNYLIAGFTFSFGAGNRDFWLFKIDDSGQVLWSCTQGNAGFQEAYTVIDAGNNQYVMAGWTDPFGQPALVGKAQYDYYIVKLSPSQSNIGLSILRITTYTIVIFAILIAALLLVLKKRQNKNTTAKPKTP